MENNSNGKKIYIFLGPPYSGKETQTTPIGKEFGIPVFSMGQLIREARKNDPKIEEAFQQYSVKGLHVPIDIKFDLLKNEMQKAENGFILDNFPATQEDLEALNKYFKDSGFVVDKVFYLFIDEEEMLKRFEENPERGRVDDTRETLLVRSKVQGVDREAVLQYFRENGKLVEINGKQSVEAVYEEIHKNL